MILVLIHGSLGIRWSAIDLPTYRVGRLILSGVEADGQVWRFPLSPYRPGRDWTDPYLKLYGEEVVVLVRGSHHSPHRSGRGWIAPYLKRYVEEVDVEKQPCLKKTEQGQSVS